MNILLFGATGMVGQGVLRECLRVNDVTNVTVVVRTPTGQHHPKLREIIHADFTNYTAIESQLAGFDACFFCLGISSLRMTEAAYTRVTYDFTIAAADTLVRLNPEMTFVYVTGAGTDSTEQGRQMWARVKGRTENALRQRPFKAVYLFRPGFIQPMHGVRSKTGWYNAIYTAIGPLIPLLRRLFPSYVLTTEEIGEAMLAVARRGATKAVLDVRDIATLARH